MAFTTPGKPHLPLVVNGVYPQYPGLNPALNPGGNPGVGASAQPPDPPAAVPSGKKGRAGKSARPKPEPDPRLKHPAILCIKGITGRLPPHELYDELIRVLGERPDGEKLATCRVEWVKRGYNRNSWAWALEWYPGGAPDRNTPAVGGNGHKPAHATEDAFDIIQRRRERIENGDET